MRNPIKNAWQSLLHDPGHIVFALYRRMPWLIPNDELYLRIYYWLSLRKKLNLNPPVLYNEKLQWLKLYNRRPEYVQMVDKYSVKELVRERLGSEYVIPTLGVWDKPSDIEYRMGEITQSVCAKEREIYKEKRDNISWNEHRYK